MYTPCSGNRSEWTETLLVLPFKSKPINNPVYEIPTPDIPRNTAVNKEKNEKAGVHLPSFNVNVPPQKEQKETPSTSYQHIFEKPEQYRTDASTKLKNPDYVSAASSSSVPAPNVREASCSSVGGDESTYHSSHNGSYSSRGKDAPYQYPSYIHASDEVENSNGETGSSGSSRRGSATPKTQSTFEYPTYIYKTRNSAPAPSSDTAAQPAIDKTARTATSSEDASAALPIDIEKTPQAATPTEHTQAADKRTRPPPLSEITTASATDKRSRTPSVYENTADKPLPDRSISTPAPSLFSTAPSASVKAPLAAESTEDKSNLSSSDSQDVLPNLFIPEKIPEYNSENASLSSSRKSSVVDAGIAYVTSRKSSVNRPGEGGRDSNPNSRRGTADRNSTGSVRSCRGSSTSENGPPPGSRIGSRRSSGTNNDLPVREPTYHYPKDIYKSELELEVDAAITQSNNASSIPSVIPSTPEERRTSKPPVLTGRRHSSFKTGTF